MANTLGLTRLTIPAGPMTTQPFRTLTIVIAAAIVAMALDRVPDFESLLHVRVREALEYDTLALRDSTTRSTKVRSDTHPVLADLRPRDPRSVTSWFLSGMGCVLLVGATLLLSSFPAEVGEGAPIAFGRRLGSAVLRLLAVGLAAAPGVLGCMVAWRALAARAPMVAQRLMRRLRTRLLMRSGTMAATVALGLALHLQSLGAQEIEGAPIASAIESFRRRALSDTRPVNYCLASFFWDETGRLREPQGVRLAVVTRERPVCDTLSRTALGVHVHSSAVFADSLLIEGATHNETGAHRDVDVFLSEHQHGAIIHSFR